MNPNLNDLTPWEKQLQCWTPRRPSERLKRELFGHEAAPATEPASARPREWFHADWRWLAPVAACLVALPFSLSLWLTRSNPRPYIAMAGGSNMLASLSAPARPVGMTYDYEPATRSQENIWSVATFDWTKANPSLSITGSFPLWKTNIQKL